MYVCMYVCIGTAMNRYMASKLYAIYSTIEVERLKYSNKTIIYYVKQSVSRCFAK